MTGSLRLSAAWFGVGVVVTTATQLRMAGLPVGLGELMLLAWLFFAWAWLLTRGSICIGRGGGPILAFWATAVGLLVAGWISKLLLGLPDYDSTYQEFAGFLFVATLLCFFVVMPHLRERVLLALHWAVLTAAGSLAALLVVGVAGVGAGPLDVWYLGVRFRGWAANPNQIALLLAPIPFLALWLRSRERGRVKRAVWLTVTVLAVAAGLASLSDALVVGWVGIGFLLLVAAWYRFAMAPSRGYLRPFTTRMLVPGLAFVALLLVVSQGVAIVGQLAAELYATGGGARRFAILGSGMRAIGASPLVGLGPGAHAGVETAFADLDVHNTLIDWGTRTGGMGLLLFSALVVWVAARSWSNRSVLLVASFLALGVFGMFHFVLRQPVFWFYLLVFACAEAPRAKIRVPREPLAEDQAVA
jgi:O-antigen ligase